MAKIKVVILGPGNIGTDLMYKVMRSNVLEMGAMIGIDPESAGLKRAEKLGIPASAEGIDYLKNNPDCAEIVFDATTAKAHAKVHAPVLAEMGKIAIDLTPAAVGKIATPMVNMKDCLNENNVNLITCGGQATTPIVHAINQVVDVEYAEVVSTVASKSAGPGTRANIDEYCSTTSKALRDLGGADRSKVFTIFNPAVPEIPMRNTVFCIPKEDVDIEEVKKSVKKMVKGIQEYVPGYELTMEPIINNSVITTTVSVHGAGDFLPSYAGNLDMETSSALKMAEMFADKMLRERGEI
ncbi:acetaldehyde dehydrogenase (acetylating) [Maledivibacter halophilus]|uniref:Acetaldehyde dehydrogenase n=1 Tax=Maledivibacter halophilus TaxID=36842 RepID=A0A1T5MDG0_9FIRM|nr:acetaldehyde dehydrogenase (acetylating) [Maledivibacter halophilus]SKC86123.1 acetaldehyde dehydrogenase [Maledivibacter halophilus]